MTLTALSAFAGIGGIDLGLERHGIRVAAQIEWDPAASRVLATRWPDVPRFGDVTKVSTDDLRRTFPDGRVDLISGGFPCQDVSVAGRRAGLAGGTRSGLYRELIRIAEGLDPDWLVVENVPGLLSADVEPAANGGKECADARARSHHRCSHPVRVQTGSSHGYGPGTAFAVVLRDLTGYCPPVPEGGWRNSGVCVGPRRSAAWRVLDAQHVGVAQRRRRVFIVCHARDRAAPAAVLLECEGLRGNPPPGRTSWAQAARGAARGAVRDRRARADRGRAAGLLADGDVVTSLTQGLGSGGADAAHAQAGWLVPHVVPPIMAGGNATGGTRPPDTNVDTAESLVVASSTGRGWWDEGDSVSALAARDYKSPNALCVTGEVTHALTSEGADASEDGTGRGTPLAFHVTQDPISGPVTPALGRESTVGVMTFVKRRRAGEHDDSPESWAESDTAPTIDAAGHGPRTATAVIETLQPQGMMQYAHAAQARSGEALRSLRDAVGAEAFSEWFAGITAALQPAEILRPELHGGSVRRPPEQVDGLVHDPLAQQEGNPAWVLRAVRGAERLRRPSHRRRSYERLTRELGESLPLLSPKGASAAEVLLNLREAAERAGLLRKALSAVQEVGRSPRGEGQPAHSGNAPSLGGAGVTSTVRRLTPRLRECERLQGFPDDWTLIPGTSDNARYRQLGNAVCVNVAEWLGWRIAAYADGWRP